MRQAQTLNDAQLRRVVQYCRSRRHPTRDETIVLFSFYAGLRAKELAALKRGDVFDETGAVREQFILSAAQSKGGKTRTVFLSQRLRRALSDYGAELNLDDPQRALFESQKGGHFSANTMCQLFRVMGPGRARQRVEIEHRVDDGAHHGDGVVENVLPAPGGFIPE